MNMISEKINEYLNDAYSWEVVFDRDSGRYSASIEEFPGCLAEGQTRQEALSNLENIAKSWLEISLERGLTIPPPRALQQYSGNIPLRVPKPMHKQIAEHSDLDGVSRNQFIVNTLSEKFAVLSLIALYQDRIDLQLRELTRKASKTEHVIITHYNIPEKEGIYTDTTSQSVQYPIGNH